MKHDESRDEYSEQRGSIKEIFTYISCLSDNDVFIFSFQFNEANASTKSDKLDVQQTSQQPVVKQQNKSVNVSKDKVVATQTKVQTPSKVTNRNQASLQRQWHLLNEHMLLQHM